MSELFDLESERARRYECSKETEQESPHCPACGSCKVILEPVAFPDSLIGHQYKCEACEETFI